MLTQNILADEFEHFNAKSRLALFQAHPQRVVPSSRVSGDRCHCQWQVRFSVLRCWQRHSGGWAGRSTPCAQDLKSPRACATTGGNGNWVIGHSIGVYWVIRVTVGGSILPSSSAILSVCLSVPDLLDDIPVSLLRMSVTPCIPMWSPCTGEEQCC